MPTYNDTSYLARICYIPFVFIWMVIRTWQTNRQEPFSLLRLELRPLFILSFSFALVVSLAHDIILYMIKINEGYIEIAPKKFIEKPVSNWTANDLRLYNISNYLDSVSISFIMTSILMLQIFWNYVLEQLSKKTFFSLFEYWIYLVLSILLLPIFPVLSYLLDALVKDPKYRENVPRLTASGIALILCFTGGLRVHFRIKQLLESGSRPTSQNEGKLKYFQDLNTWFNTALFIWSASYIVISINGILSMFVMNRFISDLLIANSNFGGLILYICIISIFNPNFPVKPKKRVISKPFDVSRVSHIVIGPDRQIMVETSQDVKVEQAFINPYYRPFTTTPPLSPSSGNNNNLLTPMPSPSSQFAEGLSNRNFRLTPLSQNWKPGQSISDVSSHQTSDNDQDVLTEHVGTFGVAPTLLADDADDESWKHDEILNESQTYAENNNDNYNNSIKKKPSQNDMSQSDMSSVYSRFNSM